MKIIIIGASFAGLACALEARSLYPQAQIAVFEATDQLAYFPSSLQWSLRRQDQAFTSSHWKTAEELAQAGIELYLGQPVDELDPEKQTIGSQGQVYSYDKLVLAMGASSDSTLIEGSRSQRVASLKTWQQGQEAFRGIQEAQRVAIVGGGPIGIEASQTCLALGKQVQLFEAGPYLDFKQFDQDFTEDLSQRMLDQGLDLHINERIESIKEEGQDLLLTSKQGTYEADYVILGVNFRANSQLAAGLLDLHVDGRIQVDPYLKSSDPNIFAVGDLAYLPSLQEEAYTPLVSTAIRSGQVAAANLLFDQEAFPPLIRLLGFRHFGLYRISVGLLESEVQDPKELLVSHFQDAGLAIKSLWDRPTGRLLGLQAQSEDNCLALGNDVVTAIRHGLSDQDLAMREFIYAPQEERLGLALHQAFLQARKERLSL